LQLPPFIESIRTDRRKQAHLALGLILIAALVTRLYRLGSAPPGISGDELFNAIDARRIGAEWPLYFGANFGREALFFYALALSTRLLGQTVFAIRLPAVLFGTGSVLLAYAVGREGFNRRVGLLAAGLTAVSLWPVMESRWALRAVTLTFCTALTIFLMQRGLRSDRRRDWLLGGIALGLTMYTYVPSRVFPAVIAVWFVWLFFSRREVIGQQWPDMALSLLVGLIIFAPYGIYMLRNPLTVNQRIYTMKVALDYALEDGDWEPVGESVGGVARMFSIEGDEEWRYHVSGRPVFDPLTSVFFYLGMAICLWFAFYVRSKRKAGPNRGGDPHPLRPAGFDNQASYALLLLWAGAMLAPNAIDEANASFLRAAGAIVPLYLITAVGFDALAAALAHHWPVVGKPPVIPALAAAGLIATLVTSWHSYFTVWNTHAEVRRIYEADLAMIGRYLEATPPPTGTRVFIADTYAHDMAPRALAFFSDYRASWFNPEGNFVWSAGEAAWYLVPGDSPLSGELIEHLGLEPDATPIPYDDGQPAFTLYHLAPPTREPEHQIDVSFVDAPQLTGFDLVGGGDDADAIYRGDTITLVLYWQIPADQPPLPTQLAFALAELSDGQGNVWAKGGELIGYPQSSWQDGDRFAQAIHLDVPAGMVPGPAWLRFNVHDSQGARYAVSDGDNQAGPFIVRSQPSAEFTLAPDTLVLDGTLALRKSTLSTLLAPGLPLDIALDWLALEPPTTDYRVQLQLIQPGAEEPFFTQTFGLWPDTYPTSQWGAGEQVSTFHRFEVPLDIPTDANPELRVLLLSADGDPLPITQGDNKLADMTLSLREHLFEVPHIDHPFEADFGGSIRLLGYDLDTGRSRPGGEIGLTLYWLAVETPGDNYHIFNHLIGSDGQLYGQFDNTPSGDAWLMTTWLPGEVIIDVRVIPVWPEATGGRYTLVIGLYESVTGERVPVSVGGQPQPNDQVVLAEVEVR
jgi:4-amino-4-deoxy-L-arabinose transferase-like glycosyltransferase